MHEDCLLQEHSQQKQQCWHSSNSFSSCNPVEALYCCPTIHLPQAHTLSTCS